MKITVPLTLGSLCLIIDFSLGLSSCIEMPLDIHEGVTLTTDWSNRMQDIAVPKSYRVRIGEKDDEEIFQEKYDEFLQGDTNVINYSFSRNVYRIRMYNPAEKITVKGAVASVAVTGNFAEAQPDWFFTASEEVSMSGNNTESLMIAMQQQLRQLDLVFMFISDRSNKLTNIDAVLGGVAGSWDIDQGAAEGPPVRVKPVFVEKSAEVYQATVRLLGVTGDEQPLQIKLSFSESTGVTKLADISLRLAGFNTDKKTPLRLSMRIMENRDESGFTTVFSEWEDINETVTVLR
jgi:hypothetical protein